MPGERVWERNEPLWTIKLLYSVSRCRVLLETSRKYAFWKIQKRIFQNEFFKSFQNEHWPRFRRRFLPGRRRRVWTRFPLRLQLSWSELRKSLITRCSPVAHGRSVRFGREKYHYNHVSGINHCDLSPVPLE